MARGQGPAGSESRWSKRRLLPRGTSAALPGGAALAAIVDRTGIISAQDRARVLSLAFLAVGTVLLLCVAGHRTLGYARQAVGDKATIGAALARSLRYETWLATGFTASGLIERSWPNGAVEFGISGIGYCGLIIVCGRIHDLADQLRLLSLTTAVLRSPAVADLKGALRPWRPAVGERGPPMVERAAASLERVPLAAKTSVVMTALAMILCGVAVANTGAALDAATAVISGLAKVPSKTARARHGTPSAGASGTVHPPALRQHRALPRPSYANWCISAPEPGTGAPTPESRELYDLWLGPTGVGAMVGGCAELAREVRPSSGVWYTVGRLGAGVVSLGVATADGPPALLLGQAARFGFTKVDDRTLTGASRRVRAGAGDLQTVDTTSGSYVLLRDRLVDSTLRAATGGVDVAAAYTVLPPGIAGPWLAAVTAVVWSWPTAESGPGSLLRYTFRTEEGLLVGEATCTTAVACTVTIAGRTTRTKRGAHVDIDTIVSAAPEVTG